MKSRRSGRGLPRRGVPLGQHFLTGPWAARTLAHAVNVGLNETILEIGPGRGALTRELLSVGHVVAIEKDAELIDALRRTFSDEIASGRLHLICGDIRDIAPETLGLERYLIAANIPYYITGEIIRQFLTARMQPRAMALLVQKEVAERIIARDEKASILSLSVKAYGTPRIVAKVGRGNFSPPPEVDSAILLIDGISRGKFLDVDEETFFKAVRAGFSSKRKYLSTNLANVFGKVAVATAFSSCKIPAKCRAEDVDLNAWLRLARALQNTSRT